MIFSSLVQVERVIVRQIISGVTVAQIQQSLNCVKVGGLPMDLQPPRPQRSDCSRLLLNRYALTGKLIQIEFRITGILMPVDAISKGLPKENAPIDARKLSRNLALSHNTADDAQYLPI
ncbi:MAG: hypothetical protein Q8M03_13840 [Legionella sp.]|nr:hypothetical protein [Legionella sp.]